MREIRLLKDEEKKQVREILEALPDWFGIPEALDEYVRESKKLAVIGCLEDHRVLGFLTMKETSKETLEIYVMGVLPMYHGKGIWQRYDGYDVSVCEGAWLSLPTS